MSNQIDYHQEVLNIYPNAFCFPIDEINRWYIFEDMKMGFSKCWGSGINEDFAWKSAYKKLVKEEKIKP